MPDRHVDPKFQLLAIASRIAVKAFRAKTEESVRFIIVNDTIHLLRYQRAILVSFINDSPTISTLSGQTEAPVDVLLQKDWTAFFKTFQPYEQIQVVSAATNPHEVELRKKVHIPLSARLIWVPLMDQDRLQGALLLEEKVDQKSFFSQNDIVDMMSRFLGPCYAVALRRFSHKNWMKNTLQFLRKKVLWIGVALILALFLIHIPLRIVSPSEVVPKDPIVIAAPLEGIVEEVIVRPGEDVGKGKILFEYDKEVPLQNLAVAKKEVEILQSEVDRALTLGFTDPKSLQELAVLQLKLEKQKIELDLAEYQVGKLTVKAPEAGIVVMKNPYEWRGKPVDVGEKVMELSDPKRTMVRIWIPESDNIVFSMDRPVKVYLNITPERSYEATLIYVANEATIDEKGIPSFIAEADWLEVPEDVKIGLRGTAVLYGERVTLFYWIIRRPWAYLRYLTGI